MIPIYLKIAGIYSYRETQEIDFRTLTASHLFGIFGAVGSGKSAILEAIMFALYGETERLNNRDSRAYNMMNLKSNDAFIQFDFLAPGDKGSYRVVVKGKRNRRDKEDVTFVRSLYQVSGDDMIPVDTGEITTILGISYDNFRRSIIIPQGRFQEFLELTAKNRTDMVKELFNLHRFDLAFKTGRLQKKNDEAISNCEGRIQQLGDISGEAIAVKAEELNRLSLLLGQTRLELKEKETIESEMQRLSGLYNDLAKNRISLKELDAQKEEIQKAEQLLSDFDACVSNFKSDIDLLDNQRRQLAAAEQQFGKKHNELMLATRQQARDESRFALARQAYDQRDSIFQQAKELELIARINTTVKNAAEQAIRIENGEKQLNEVTLNGESLKVKARELTALQETMRTQLPDIGRLQQAKDWFAKTILLKERIEAQRQKEASLTQEFNASRHELTAIAQKHEVSTAQAENDFSLLLHQLEARRQELISSNLSFEGQLLHLEVQDKLKSLASGLEAGKPCPLCGSTAHPHVLNVLAVETDLHNIRHQKTAVESRLDLLGKSISHAGFLLGQLEKKQPELDATFKARSEAGTALLAHELGFAWPGLTTEKLNEDWKTFTTLQQEIEKLNAQIKETTLEADSTFEKTKKYTEALEGIRISYIREQQHAETLRTQLSLLDYDSYATTVAEILQERSTELMQQYNNSGIEYTAAEKIKNEVSAEVQNLSGMADSMKLSIGALTSAISRLQTELEIRVLSSRFGSEAAVREILAIQTDRANEQQRIQRFRETLASVATTIQQLELQLGGKPYDAPAHEQLKLAIGSLKITLEDQNRQKGAAENVVRILKQALETSLKLKAELDLLATRRENLKTLADLFRGQGFVNFVSTLHLQNLVNSANDRFYRLTRQQLKLELDAENNFRIRDYLNEGQWRNVKTLSGGQTFQASLCLALALADNIQQINQGGQNFFFLDEGFGTLDRESLELVFETLKTLRRENRVVGVISHVEDLQQEIAAWLRITRDDEHGSRIFKSWED